MRRFTLADGLLLATVSIWALNVTVVKLLLGHLDPMALAVVRFTITTTVFAFLVPLREGSVRVARRSLPLLAAAGLCGIWLNQVAFTYGLKNATAATITLMMTTVPLFVAVGSFLLGWERPGRRHWSGIVAGVVGVTVIVLGTPQAPGHVTSVLGQLLGLLTAASWALYSLMLRSLMQVYSPSRISLYVVAVGLLGLAPLGVPQLSVDRLAALTPDLWGLILFSSLVSVVLTNLFWYTGIHRLGPARATLYSYVQPAAGLLFALLILHEPLGLFQVAGGAIVLGGVMYGREPRPTAALTE